MANTKNEKINNNLRPLYVKEIIFEHTDEEHFLTVYDIEKRLEDAKKNICNVTLS